jgi:hypothetical protein
MEIPLMRELVPLSHPLPVWLDVLGRIEQSVRQSLVLAVEPATQAVQGTGAGAAALQALDDRLTRWQACLDQAAADTEEAAALAATEEAALAAAIQGIRQSREKLANWREREV